MKLSKRSGGLAGLALFLLFWGGMAPEGAAQADFAIGSIIRDFQLPQRDGEGKLELMIRGEQAMVMSANRIRVKSLKIDIYSGEKPEMFMTSAESDYWRLEERLTSSSAVMVEHPSFTLTSEQMNWELKESKGLFKGKVRLKMKSKSGILGE